MYYILAIIAGLGAAFAWIFKLIKDNDVLKNNVAGHANEIEFLEKKAELKRMDGTLAEEERDYEKAKEEFNHPGSKPLPPGGDR